MADPIKIMARALIDADPTISGYHETHLQIFRPTAKAAITALQSAGFRIVSVETVTEDMVEAGGISLYGSDRDGGIPFDGNYRPHARKAFIQMLAQVPLYGKG